MQVTLLASATTIRLSINLVDTAIQYEDDLNELVDNIRENDIGSLGISNATADALKKGYEIARDLSYAFAGKLSG